VNNRTSRDEQLFANVLARPEQERAAFVDDACQADLALRERLMALLKAHAGPESLLAFAPVLTNRDLREEKPGDAIGRYKLLQKIGEGGCGVVWMAEQEEPVRRRVALKVIKLGMDTKAVVARFEAERQALAMMDHACIAKVHDAGSTDTGRPYIVMELVRGIPITKYCDENHLTPKERLELFIGSDPDLQQRFDIVAHQLTHIHSLARAGNMPRAKRALLEAWPQVEEVFVAGPEYLFNQLEFARALAIRAEIAGAPEDKRSWLEQALGFVRPAGEAGKLTRYVRELLLVGIERQLAALPNHAIR
jgi:soluble cytochrome b562